MPVDPRPPMGGPTATSVQTAAAPAPRAGGSPDRGAAASDFASVMAMLRADLAAGAVLEPASAPPTVQPIPDVAPAADTIVDAAAAGPAPSDPALADPPLTDSPVADSPVADSPVAESRGAGPEGADPVDWRGMDGRDRTRQFVQRGALREAPGNAAFLLGEDGLTLGDVIDVINPLQHIPVVSTLYRWITGDAISPAANMAGGALFGGPIGFVAALASEVFEDASGRDPGEAALAMVLGDGEAGPRSGSQGGAGNGVAIAAVPAPPPARAHAEAGIAMAEPRPQDAHGGPGRPAPAGSEAAIPDGLTLAAAPSEAAFIPLSGGAAGNLPAIGRPVASGDAPAAAPAMTVPAAAIPLQMMQALDKYEALTRSRDGGTMPASAPAVPPIAGGLVDATL